MGNNTSRIGGCFAPFGTCRDTVNLEFLEPLDEGLGHSFCYVRPVIADSPAITPSNSERYTACSSTVDSETNSGSFRQEVVVEDLSNMHRHNTSLPETTFKTISGASVSANASTARTGGNLDLLLSGEVQQPAASFESTASFAAIPLQPMPRGLGPVDGFMSGPLERGFASGPLERGACFMSGPLDGIDRSNFSAPLAYGQRNTGIKVLVSRMSRPVRNAVSWTLTKRWHGSGWMKKLLLQPMTQLVWHPKEMKSRQDSSKNFPDVGTSETEYSNMKNLQWAHGKAGEDRVHVVLSEEQGWLFVGIYDGFSGPDAPDFLMSNLYKAIDKELEGLLWDYGDNPQERPPSDARPACNSHFSSSNVGGEESMLPKVHSVVTQVQFSSTQSCNDYSENRCSNEFSLSLDQKLDEYVMNPELSNVLEIGGDIVEDKVRSKNVDNKEISCEIYREQILNVLEKNTHSVCDTNVVQGKVSTCALVENSVSHYRRSKCLYELLQMELVEDSKSKDSGLASDVRCGSSRNSFKQLVSCPTDISIGSSCCLEEVSGIRETDSASGKKSIDTKEQPMPSISDLGHNKTMKRMLVGSKFRKMCKKHKSLRKKLFPWSFDWHRDQHELDDRTINPSVIIRKCMSGPIDHDAVLKAMARALETTEEAYAVMVEKALDRNPELALMGSCVLVMLMKDQDVYVMNLGDSRVVLAQDRMNDRQCSVVLTKEDSRCRNRSRESLVRVELDRISEESPMHNQNSHVCSINKNREISLCRLNLRAVQLSTDHSTGIEEEVLRIKAEHADDPQAILNERVKGHLKVTRAFGAEFLKQPRFNDALLEMFRIDYVGSTPYLSCTPSVAHHRLCSSDRFLVLSSDGLYQYFSNDEVVSHVAWFMENMPDGDPAQYLIAELLSRAAKKNGMDFHELLDIPHGDRRKYHDDVSVMVISLEGRIWRSSG